ncbi:hypothetical protein [Streptomyces sp. NPDC056480]|uniref:hypothetical protein n=1 Tax=Streptomyces sp. NPDC056480 TaxID=3345833 RepID=UPI0036B06890
MDEVEDVGLSNNVVVGVAGDPRDGVDLLGEVGHGRFLDGAAARVVLAHAALVLLFEVVAGRVFEVLAVGAADVGLHAAGHGDPFGWRVED